MEKEPLVIPNKSCKKYFLLNNNKVYFRGDFDSGNLQRAEQLSPYVYRITPGFDKTRQSTNKTFFHFKTQGFRNCKVKFIISRAYLLEQFIKQGNQFEDIYHPVARREMHLPFQKIKEDVKIYYNFSDEPELSFSFTFYSEKWVQFAFTYPYSYQDCEMLINSLKIKYTQHKEVYFHDQVLCRTSESRKVHIITVTDRRNIDVERQAKVDGIFLQGERPFKIDKPRIIVSARVHPGQTPSSFCMEGILKFLLNQQDYRSYLLRKHFHFILIPMLNPEGVYQGMFRNDLNGQNLNRMYLHCEKKHTSIWSVKKYLQSLDKVDFFFDLHAHPSRKGFFIYGNAFDEFLQQTQAQIFSKMIQYNCPYFENLDCIYSVSAMVDKDKYDSYSKQGCARVYYHKKFKMIHSYTVQCGYFAPVKLNPYPPQREMNLPIQDYQCTNDWQQFSMNQYTPQSYMMLGKSILISIIDLFHINPYTRISTSDFKSINSLRKFTAQRVYNEVERFRLVDNNVIRKMKGVVKLIEQNYYIPRFKHYGLTISQDYGMKEQKRQFHINSKLSNKNTTVTEEDNQEKMTFQKYQSEKNLLYNYRYQNPSISVQRRLKIQKAARLLEIEYIPTSESQTPKRKDVSFSKPSFFQKIQQPTKRRKMEEQIILALLQSKLRPQIKKTSEALMKIDKLTPARTKAESIKFPFINPKDKQKNHL